MLATERDCQILAKRFVKAALGKDHLIKKDIFISVERLGNQYGGWVVSKSLLIYTAQPVVMSFGIGDDITFDLEIIRRYGANVFAFDPTPKAMQWIAKQRVPNSMTVSPVGLADFDGEQDFGPPANPSWDSFSVFRREGAVRCKVAKLSTLMREHAIDTIDVLKIDIEGSEYAAIEDLCRSEIRPKQFLVEFHHNAPDLGIQLERTRDAVGALRAAGYLVFDISPWGREFSFLHASALHYARS
jgi:FkbM family methyltransferase